MNKDITTKKLRPRKKDMPNGKKPYVQVDTYVAFMTITTEDRNGTVLRHPLVFDREPLTLKEMYRRGFLGDLEFIHEDGSVSVEELEAGPVGDFDGVQVGRFVYRFNNSPYCNRLGVKVTKMQFTKDTY